MGCSLSGLLDKFGSKSGVLNSVRRRFVRWIVPAGSDGWKLARTIASVNTKLTGSYSIVCEMGVMRPAKLVIDLQQQPRQSSINISKHRGFQRSRGRVRRLTGAGALANGP